MRVKFKNKNEEIAPVVILSPEAFLKIKVAITEHSKEIMWYGVGKFEMSETDKNVVELIEITDVVFPPQRGNSGAYVESDDDRAAEMIKELRNKGYLGKVVLHGHSHPRMSTSPSGTDKNTIEETMENSTHYLQMIANEKMQYTLIYHKNGVHFTLEYDINEMSIILDDGTLLDWYSDGSLDMPATKAIKDDVNADLDNKVKKTTYTGRFAHTRTPKLDRTRAPEIAYGYGYEYENDFCPKCFFALEECICHIFNEASDAVNEVFEDELKETKKTFQDAFKTECSKYNAEA